MGITTSPGIKRLEDAFFSFCLDYFDDLPEGRIVMIKFPFPDVIYRNLVSQIAGKIMAVIAVSARFFLVKKDTNGSDFLWEAYCKEKPNNKAEELIIYTIGLLKPQELIDFTSRAKPYKKLIFAPGYT